MVSGSTTCFHVAMSVSWAGNRGGLLKLVLEWIQNELICITEMASITSQSYPYKFYASMSSVLL